MLMTLDKFKNDLITFIQPKYYIIFNVKVLEG